MSRSTRLRVDQVRTIDHFAASLTVMFPASLGVLICGSCLDRDDYRDVDLRVVLGDDHYNRIYDNLEVDDLNALLSRWGQQVTGLPIDCQIQPHWEHATEAFGPNGVPRHVWRGGGAQLIPRARRRSRVTNPAADVQRVTDDQ